MSKFLTFLDRIAEKQSSFVLFGDRVYSPIESNGYPDKMFFNGSLEFSLAPSLSFAEFESRDEVRQEEAIHKYSDRYLQEKIHQRLDSEDRVADESNRINTLSYIMNDFMPFLVSKKYDNDLILLDLLDDKDENEVFDPLEQARKEIADKLIASFGDPKEFEKSDDDFGEFMRKKLIQEETEKIDTSSAIRGRIALSELGLKRKNLRVSDFGNLIDFQPFYVLGQNVFELKKVGGKPHLGLGFRINNRNYVPSENASMSISRLSEYLVNRKKQQWKVRALEKSKQAFQAINEVMQKRDMTKGYMVDLAKLDEYDIGGCGFLRRSGSEYLVYTTLPKFATQDGRDPKKFWPFEAIRVAIKIGWGSGKAYTTDYPYIIEPSPYHPCLRDRTSGYSTLCNLNRNEGSYNNTLLEMVRKLSDAANVYMQPLNKESLDSHSGHSYFGTHLNDILRQGSMTRSQARKKGYQIVEVIATQIE